jgi:hypothetical protein
VANNPAPQGVLAIPQDGSTGRLWAGGRTRRAITTQFGFPASTTTPFSGNTPAGVIAWDAALAYNAAGSATGYGEFDLSDLTGFEITVSNAGSGQTLSGITVQDYDTLPSGLAVPGASYTSATNVATGAAVTLSALNLANNAVVRLWIPITTAQQRKLVVNPTYGAAVTAGTGALELRVVPTFGTVSLSGSLAPLTAAAPTLIATIPYSDFTASTTLYFPISGVLHRNTRRRTFFSYNTMDKPLSAAQYGVVLDSTIGLPSLGGTNFSGASSVQTFSGFNSGYGEVNSDQITGLNAQGDSIVFALPMGATAPTTGSLKIWLVEEF